MESLLSRLDTSAHPTYGELQYIVDLLYNGYYGFEALTKRDLNGVICGLSGIAGKIYYGDGNEKNCCTMMNINIKESSKNAPTQETQVQDIEEDAVSDNDESKLDLCLDRIENQLIERCIYASKRNETLTMNIEDIPLLIPSLQSKHELNTEMKKKSCYLKDTDKIEGDAMILSKIINEGRFSMENIDKIDDGSLYNICRECNIKPQNNSKAFLKLSILKLYESIVTGKSSCHEFVKAPGKTGGFYHFVCPHGTTVCSKFMVLCESVRDAADLWLSLKYPPVLFICDTPCTLTQHLNNREPDLMKQYWGDLNGCFQKPEIDTKPNTEVNVPALVPSEFKTEGEKYDGCKEFEHPVTRTKQRYVCGDRFHARSKPHKSPLCSFHDIELCQQGCGITTSHQESMNNKKNNLRNRSSCSQNIATHIFYNYLMNFYENELVVMQQQQDLKRKSGKSIQRDELMRFVISD
ncbi:HMG domain-containing protein 3-like isoform X1 [Clytia hemisphaerica]|uniref:Uncharacterized protein n=1 Tax=Clytia hemisphaerica TaxID=252671 RepID=A0A7M6DLS9_9CNID